MDRVSIYEYDRKNRERVVKAIEEAGGQILSWSFFAKDQSKFELPPGTLSVFIDLSSLFYNEDRADALIAPAELLLNIIQQEQSVALYVIIERQYSKQVRDLLYYKIDEVLNLEDFLEIEKDPIQNIVDIDQSDFENVLAYLNFILNHSSIGIPSMHSWNFPFSCGFLSTLAVECSVLNFSLCSFE